MTTELELLREELLEIDKKMILLLSERQDLVREIGKIKTSCQLPLYQLEKWEAFQIVRTNLGERKNLDHSFLTELFELIHKNSLEIQQKEI